MFIQHLKIISIIGVFIFLNNLLFGANLQRADLYGWWVIDKEFVKDVMVDMEKDTLDEDKKMLKVLMPMIEEMIEKQTLIFTENEMIRIFGFRENKAFYSIKGIEGNIFTIESKGHQSRYIIEDGRLVNELELNDKRPAMYMKKLTADEVTIRKNIIEEAKQPPVETETPDKRLTFLVYRATLEQIDQLLATQKDLLTLKFRDETALQLAVRKKKLELVKKLIFAGADVHVKNKKNENLLFTVARSPKPNLELFELLLEQGLDVKQLNQYDESILATFCRSKKNIKFLKYLISLDLDINQKSIWGHTALSNALRRGWWRGVEELLASGGSISSCTIIISDLVREGDFEAIRFLWEKGLKKDSRSKTALMHALDSNGEKAKNLIPLLIELNQGELELKDFEGKSALFYAQNLKDAKLLVGEGAKIDVRSKRNESLLHISCNHLELVKYYIGKGIDVNVLNDRLETPLIHSIGYNDNFATIKFLVENGADLNAINSFKSSAIARAINKKSNERIEYLNYLLKSGADPNTGRHACIEQATSQDFEQALRILVNAGMSLETNPKEYYTPFWHALYRKNADFIRLLIALGADPLAKNAKGQTALDIAKEMKSSDEILEILSKRK